MNAAGCISTPANATPVTVTVNPRPTAVNITSTTPASICTGQTATISAIANVASVEWFTDAALTNSVGTNLSYTTPVLNATTIYYVAAKSAAGCLAAPSGAVPVTVTVNTRPTAANITGTTPTTICTGTTGTISATTDAASVEWYTDAALTNRVGTSLSYTTPVLTANTTYYVVAKNAAGCIGLPAAAQAVTVTVSQLPFTPNITGASTICEGNQTTYTTEPDMFDYLWTITGGTIISGGGSTNNFVTVTWPSAGTGNITLTYENEAQCAASPPASFNVTIYESAPEPIIDGDGSVCLGATEVYSTTPGMTNYVWEAVGGTITSGGGTSDNTVTVLWPAATEEDHTVTVIYTSPDGCVSSQGVLDVTLSDNLIPTIAGPGHICGSSSASYTTESDKTNYTWSVTGGTITGGGTTSDRTVTIFWGLADPATVSVSYSGDGTCVSNTPTTMTVNINERPTLVNILTTTPATICTGVTATISATTDAASVQWFTDAALTNRVGVDLSYTTPVLNATTTYYVAARSSAGCLALPADAAPVTVTVNARPTLANITGTTSATICSDNDATISATTDAASVEWYSDAALTNLISTNLSYITPALNVTTNYYVVAKNAAGCIALPSGAATVTVTVNPRPTAVNITNTTDAVICSGNTANLSATTDAAGVNWYSDASLTNLVGTELSYTTPVLNMTTFYFVAARSAAGCIAHPSDAKRVTATVNDRPTAADITTTTPATICAGEVATVSATTTENSVEWYSDAGLTNRVGTDLSYITPILNTTTNYYVVAKNIEGCIALPAEAVTVTVTVNARPTAANITSTTGAVICTDESATITAATDAASVEWYSDAALTNLLTDQLSYVTPDLMSTTNYYVVAKNAAGCIGLPTEAVTVTVTVNTRPTAANITGTTGATICTDETATISATTDAASVEWYDDADLTDLLATTLSFTTPELNTTTDYYVVAKNAAGCIALPADAVVVTVTVNDRPTLANITSTTPATICMDDDATISATTDAASVEWYSDAALTNLVGTGLSYTTPALTVTTNYYVAAKNAAGCIALPSGAATVTVTVNPRPTAVNITNTTDAVICSGNTATLSATTDAAGVNWYSDASLTNLVGTGLSYTTPVLNMTTFYFVAARSAAGCIAHPSEAVRVTATVNDRPTAADIPTTTPAMICVGETATISATATTDNSVEWYSDAGLTNRVGTDLSYTTPVLNVTTNYYVVAKNIAGCIALPSEAKMVTVTVNTRPTAANITSATGAVICTDEPATISATTDAASVEWYSDAALTNLLGDQLTYVTPDLMSTTNYYVVAKNAAGCIALPAEAVTVTVTVNNRPTVVNITGTTGATICTDETATISATTDAASVEWYDDADLIDLLGTGLSFTTPELDVTTDFYVVAKNAAGCIGLPADAVAVTVTVNARPTIANITSISPATICSDESATISAETTAASVEWYSDADLTIRVGTDLSYTTPILDETTNYYVVAKNAAGCIALPSGAIMVTVTVNPRPVKADITGTTGAVICSGGSATISATTTAARVNWYSDAALTVEVGDQLSYTTPALTATTTYYVAGVSFGCVALPADAVPVTVTVNDRPTAANVTSTTPATICSGKTATISATTDLAKVDWYSDAALTVKLGSNLSYTTPVLTATTTYYVVAENIDGCMALPSEATTVTVTVNPLPTEPNITGTTPATICSGQTATISATTDLDGVEWYSDAALIVNVGSGLSYTTPALTATTTYYVVARSAAGCIALPADATEVIVTVNALPTEANITGTTPTTVCAGKNATISATTDLDGVEWFSDAALTVNVSSNLTYTTPALTTTTYYVVARNAAGCIALPEDATPVTIIVLPLPTHLNITSTTSATICSGGIAAISVTTDLAGVEWYSNAALTNNIGSGLSYTTPSLTATTTYYVAARSAEGCIAPASEAVPVTVTVYERPTTANITSTTAATICDGETATISATTDLSGVEWYSDMALTDLLSDDLSYTTPALNATTTYYVIAVTVEGCRPSPPISVPVTVTVNPRPTVANILTTTGAQICDGETATISATTDLAGVEWYSDAALTMSVGTGLTYTTSVLDVTTSYYVVAISANGCHSLPEDAVEVIVTVVERPTKDNITSTNPADICAGQTATISASTNLASVEWYSDAALTNKLSDELSYTTPALTVNTVYYVVAKNAAGCIALPADAVPVTVEVNSRPTTANITGTTPASVCMGESATISATSDVTSAEWYTDAALTNLVGKGLSYTTPGLTANTTYYVSAENAAGCIVLPGEATPVLVTVVAYPTEADITTTTPATICMGTQATICATTDMAEVYWYSDAALTDLVGIGLCYTTPELDASTTYYAAAVTFNGCIASTGKEVPVTVLNIPAPVPVITGTDEACGNSTATYTTESGMTNYVWDAYGGEIVSGSGTYNVTVMWLNEGFGSVGVHYFESCPSRSTILEVSLDPATVIVSQPQSTAACRMSPLQLSVTAEGTNLSYQWFKDGAPIDGATSPTYEVASMEAENAGEYTVVVNSDCGPVTSQPATVTVAPSEIVQKWDDVIFIDNICFCKVAYQWYRNGTFLDGETKQFFEEKGGLDGTYIAEVTLDDGTKYFTCPLTVVKSKAISVKVYPNPVVRGKELHIEVDASEPIDNMILELYTTNGRLLNRQNVENHKVIIPVTEQVGAYMLRIVTPEKSFVRTVIVE